MTRASHKELMAIYVARGLNPAASETGRQAVDGYDALGAHARDELGISETFRARPFRRRWHRRAALLLEHHASPWLLFTRQPRA